MDQQIAINALICFFCGSIPFAVIAMWGSGIDIRQVGSGNPGFNNVLRVSKPRAAATLAGDMGKGLLPVMLLLEPDAPSYAGWLYGFAAVFGHCYSPWLKFNGGKGIATSGGVMLALFPQLAALALAFFALLRVLASRRKWPEAGAISSISTWLLFTIALWPNAGPLAGRNAALMTLFLAWRHKDNFRRLVTRVRPGTTGSSG